MNYINDAFYWVKLKPYCPSPHEELVTPPWEPMQRHNGKWLRVGVVYNFQDDEVEKVGKRIDY